MATGASLLSLMATGVYALVILACLVAAASAYQARQWPSHWKTWLFIAVLFGILVFLRFYAIEEMIRDTVRAYFRSQGNYGDRRSLQAPLVAMLIVIAAATAFAFFYRMTRRLAGRRNLARLVASIAALALVFLVVLRLASLHLVDALLYGPVKLNWVIDLGASLTVLGAAFYYTRLVRRQG